ncbi:conserved hypothetical protein, membrane, partial [mine drainage metagenome]
MDSEPQFSVTRIKSTRPRLYKITILKDSIRRLSPMVLYRNVVMFIVEICFMIVAIMAIDPSLIPDVSSSGDRSFYLEVAIVLILTVWFSTLSDSIAEAQ